MRNRVQNQLAAVRRRRGLGAADLAQRTGVSRQTIYAIEAGAYVPNTEVTLRLARELEVTVEELFSLPVDIAQKPVFVPAEVLGSAAPENRVSVRVCKMGDLRIGVPVSAAPYYLPEADGVISRMAGTRGRADLLVVSREEQFENRLILAGCDPATGLLARMVEQVSGVEIVPAAASSKLALSWLKDGKVHIAGSHLEDPKTGEFNLPFLRREFPKEDFTVVTFAHWEEGLVTARGNAKRVKSVDDLGREDVRFMNREPGSGSRALIDRMLSDSGIHSRNVKGFERVAYGHLAAAYSVLAGEADCCLATRSAAQAFGLEFIPLHAERYDLVMLRQALELPAVQSFLDVLQRASLRRKLEVLAGYDTAQTGSRLV